MFKDLLLSIELASRNLRSNKGRTILTLVGIVIGITSVIVIMSSGQGVKGFILGQIEGFGTDVIQIETKVPNTGKNSSANAGGQAQGIQITTLRVEDADSIAKMGNVQAVNPGTIGQEIVSYQNVNKRAMIYGNGSDAPRVDGNLKMSEGTFYTDAEDRSLAQVIVIGSEIRDSLFGKEEALGKSVKIKGQSYRVIGVIEKRGTVAFFNYDTLVYMPTRTVLKKILGVDYIRFITVKVRDASRLEESILDLTDRLRDRHDITDPNKDDFSVTSIKEAQDTINKVFGTINILLLALTSISLIVGGVGIMNVMYVAVTERTFEIGLRKAVGAKSTDILKQFLFEAIFITFLGGAVGIVLGFLFSALLSYVFRTLGYNLQFVTTWQSLLLATGFSVGVGILFGYYPARKASQLSPMEALRKE